MFYCGTKNENVIMRRSNYLSKGSLEIYFCGLICTAYRPTPAKRRRQCLNMLPLTLALVVILLQPPFCTRKNGKNTIRPAPQERQEPAHACPGFSPGVCKSKSPEAGTPVLSQILRQINTVGRPGAPAMVFPRHYSVTASQPVSHTYSVNVATYFLRLRRKGDRATQPLLSTYIPCIVSHR